jgi:hypothetical protein
MDLSPYNKFEAIISPFLSSLAENERNSILREMYRLAEKKHHLEQVKEFTTDQVKPLRRVRMKFKQKRSHIKNAIKELRQAQILFPEPTGRAFFQGKEVQIGCDLNQIIAELEEEHQALAELELAFALSIPPQLRTPSENKPPVNAIKYVTPVPGFNVTAVDYWFISELARVLLCLGSRETVVDVKRTRIIDKTFEAAFGHTYGFDRVETARKRMRERARPSHPRLPGQKE